MKSFVFHNPVKVIFGEHAVSQHLGSLLPPDSHVLITAGGGSIRKNKCYDEVISALRAQGIRTTEFWGIEPNPDYETLMRAVHICKTEGVNHLLALGGGSVLDGTKFIAAAARFSGSPDPWQILCGAPVTQAIPLSCVLTLPATGSESNCFSVISHRAKNQKRAFAAPAVFPQFAILDPRYVTSLPPRQITNGIVDPFVHVMEQYCTLDVDTPLQDQFAEAILKTLIAYGPRCLKDPQNTQLRGQLMWCATQALNGTLACGVVEDWATHAIGHELTALYGLDHAQTLAIVLPALLSFQSEIKGTKLKRYAQEVWGMDASHPHAAAMAIERTAQFFNEVGAPTRLSAYGISATDIPKIAAKVMETSGGRSLGEKGNLDEKALNELLKLAI